MKTQTPELSIPTVHMNGTSKNELLDQLSSVYEALDNVLDVMRNASPNGRDYYTQEHGSFEKAVTEHRHRALKVYAVRDEVETLIYCIDDAS